MGPWAVCREVIPLHDIKVRCRVAGVTKATQQPENINLPLTKMADGAVEVTVPRVDMYTLVILE